MNASVGIDGGNKNSSRMMSNGTGIVAQSFEHNFGRKVVFDLSKQQGSGLSPEDGSFLHMEPFAVGPNSRCIKV